ncbi:MAG: DUF6301 family protein [Propionibacteriaceae bacterium]|nr:DUF6301 family protein [Propionibacteriaceae bacterium]
MTWNALTPERVVELVQYWISQDWPLTSDKVPAAMAGVGWVMGEDGRWQADSVPLARQNLSAVAGYEEKGLDHISWNVTDVVREGSVERDGFMNDAYAGYVKAFGKLWGKPRRLRRKEFVASHWDVSNGCRVKVMNRHSAVSVYINSPRYAQVLRNLERR